MNSIQKLCRWWFLLQKRLLKKPLFVLLLLLIPILCVGFRVAAGEDSGVLTIALAQQGSDPLASAVIEDLAGSSQLIRFRICADPEEAEVLVRQEKADAAWVFPDNMRQRLEIFVAEPRKSNAFITVMERENNVLLQVSHEKLGGAMYALCAEHVYLNYIRQNIPAMADASEEELLHYYHSTGLPTELFQFTQADGSPADGSVNILTAPIRGLLAVVIVLCGLSAAMYYTQDQSRGVFCWLPAAQRPWAELGCLLVATGDLSLAAMLSLCFSGLAGRLLLETAAWLLFSLCAAVFSMMLRRLTGSVRGMATALPLLVTAMLVICPVFFDLGVLRSAQYLLPPTYYINCVYNTSWFLSMVCYTLICAGICLLLGLFSKKK